MATQLQMLFAVRTDGDPEVERCRIYTETSNPHSDKRQHHAITPEPGPKPDRYEYEAKVVQKVPGRLPIMQGAGCQSSRVELKIGTPVVLYHQVHKLFLTMGLAATFGVLASLLAIKPSAQPARPGRNLYVTETPDDLRLYVLAKNYGTSLLLANQVMRIPVSSNSSAGAFTILQISAPESAAVGVEPHIHKRYYENFYCSRGRLQLWTQSNTSDAEQNTRILTQGDFGAVAHNTIHTFQTLDPDTMFTVVIQPGGFERLFLYGGGPEYDSPIGSAFLPADALPSSATPPLEVLQSFDHWPMPDFIPRRDDTNGIAGSGNWHNGSNKLASDATTPFYIAKNWGPKYLNSEGGIYKIIAPL
ncbi:hypothetical protein DL769_005285 [Monosporascus sp. CRB-8-3]|nr:hypothetical protein DL769_005285 [Monosporascus sp. CRB-8-3]